MSKTPDNILITTGIYPPEIGGPAGYARELFDTFLTQKYSVSVMTFGVFRKFPTGIRHILYFLKLLYSSLAVDYIIALDTFSVALPSLVFAKITGKKIVIRVAGDFLWESYVERTKTSVLLSEFYSKNRNYTFKENFIFGITRFVLNRADGVVFSTEWQKNIMLEVYGLDKNKISIINNFFPKVEIQQTATNQQKVFLSPSRDIYIKNKERLFLAFNKIKEKHPEVVLDTRQVSSDVLGEKIIQSYAVIVPSFSEVSSNLVCDALRYDIPVIVTKDNGMLDKLENIAVLVNPLSVDDIIEGVEKLLNEDTYKSYKEKIFLNPYNHSWNEIVQEYVDLYSKI